MLKSAPSADLPKHDPEGQAILKRMSSAFNPELSCHALGTFLIHIG